MATKRYAPTKLHQSAHSRVVTMILALSHIQGRKTARCEAEQIATEILGQLRGTEMAEFVLSFESYSLDRVAALIAERLTVGIKTDTRTTRSRH